MFMFNSIFLSVVPIDEEKTRKRIYEELPKCNWLEEKIKNIELAKQEEERRNSLDKLIDEELSRRKPILNSNNDAKVKWMYFFLIVKCFDESINFQEKSCENVAPTESSVSSSNSPASTRQSQVFQHNQSASTSSESLSDITAIK